MTLCLTPFAFLQLSHLVPVDPCRDSKNILGNLVQGSGPEPWVQARFGLHVFLAARVQGMFRSPAHITDGKLLALQPSQLLIVFVKKT